MSETKNDPQQAISVASGIIQPSMTPYDNGNKSLSISNGSACQDINKIMSQTSSIMKNFESSVEADAKNILSISKAYEDADNKTKQVIDSGR